MRRPMMLIAALLAGLLVTACGSSGKSADPPVSVVAQAGDGIVTVSWPMTPSVEYWLFFANSPSITTTNWTSILGSRAILNATSPYLLTGLTNGSVYSFTVNGRTKGGPGGEGSPSVSAIPRLAGTATASLPAPWTAGTALGADTMRGLMLGAKFVAVGTNGAMFSSTDATNWTASNPGVATNLNAAAYAAGAYIAAGDGGALLRSTDTISWTAQSTGTANNLYAIAANTARMVAVGAKGTIVTSTDGITWAAAADSATTEDLYAVTAFNSLWIAVGANGTMVTSTDASTWKSVASNAVLDLKGITYGTSSSTGTTIFVAVGAGGALVTSPDAVTWTAQPAIGVNTLSAVNYGTQFIAVGANGSILTSTDGTNWAGQPSATNSDLNAIVHAPYSYSVVGAAGVNLLAK